MARWSSFAPAADRRLVKGLHDGDDDVLATLYDVYAERLYDYCMALLDDSKAAADVVHDSFVDAARRAPRMRERERLRPWLYAAARRRCLQRKLQTEPAEGNPLARLDFLHREALYLAVRHDLTGDDLAATLGVCARRAQARLTRAERQVPDAAEFLDTTPAPVVPAALRHRVQHTGTDPELAGYRAEIAARGGALTPDGMPRQPDAPSQLARRWAFTSAGSLATLASAAVALLIVSPNLPVPDIEWPGGKPYLDPSPSPRTHQPRTPPQTGAPGEQQPPSSGPQLFPSIPASPGKPSRPPRPRRPGVLDVGPRSIHLRGYDTVGDLYLAAKGGPVTWTAGVADPQLTVSRTSGGIRGGGRVTIHVILDRHLITLAGESTVTVSDGAGHYIPVIVAWDTSLL
ncbi:MAG: polymerase, sigma-24 subunit, subfamily [Actinoallomurus sp.]|nr:polymerase, sigma-24 subunit, subfamily [Actinoallomurus sp.]